MRKRLKPRRLRASTETARAARADQSRPSPHSQAGSHLSRYRRANGQIGTGVFNLRRPPAHYATRDVGIAPGSDKVRHAIAALCHGEVLAIRGASAVA